MPRVRRASLLVMGALAAVWLCARFIGLGSAPPGFFFDESRVATHVLCLAERGRDGDGKAWPLFSDAFAGGHHPITLTGFDYLWTRIFGTGIAAFRAASAFWVVLTCLALFAAARALAQRARQAGPGAGAAVELFPWLVLTAAALSPWSFQFSRIAWEAPIAVAFLAVAMAALVKTCLAPGWRWPVAAGAAAALSMFSYPPLRVTVPGALALGALALGAGLPAGQARRRFGKQLALAAGVGAVVLAPVVLALLKGDLYRRTSEVAIFSPQWLAEHGRGMPRWAFFFQTLFDHLAAHVRPSFLFFTGDGNGRHSAHIVGQLSPVDTLAVLLALLGAVLGARQLLRQQATGVGPASAPDAGGAVLATIALVALGCGGFGILPAALTHDGIPHALRSIGTWPFVALFTGATLALGWQRWPWLAPLTAAVATIYTVAFLSLYGGVYQRLDRHLFTRDIRDAAEGARSNGQSARAGLAPLGPLYDDVSREAFRYFLMQHDRMSCADAAAAIPALGKR